jgi:hypothetical protein
MTSPPPTPTLTIQQLLALFPKWYVGTEEQRVACTWIPPARSFVVTDEGNLYIADGQRMVKDLPLVGGSSQNFVINDATTTTGSVWSSQHTSDQIAAAVATVGSGSYDPAGAAATAQANAQAYADAKTVNTKSGHAITLTAADVGAVDSSQKGAANGVATLDATTKVPAAQIPDLSGTYGTVASVATAQSTATTAQNTANAAVQPLNPWVTKTAAYPAVASDALFLDTSGGGSVAITLGDLADKARVRLKWTSAPNPAASNPPTLVAGAIAGGGFVTIDPTFGGFGTVGTVAELLYQKSNTTWYVIDTFRPSVIDVQEFLASGTWYKPAGCKYVLVEMMGSGGGGGGGGRQAAGVVSTGGGGGGGGGYTMRRFLASDLPSTVALVVSTGGTAGAAATADSSSGGGGGSGSVTRFGTGLSSFYCAAAGGGGGNGGGTASATGGGSAFGVVGGAGGAASSGTGAAGSSGNTPNLGGAPGGGSGGGITTGNVFSAGGDGGNPWTGSGIKSAGGATDGAAAGATPTTPVTNTPMAGAAGGGGASSVAGVGGAGAPGAIYGAGGGGGGASRNGQASGAGAAGAPGIMLVTSYF